MIPKGSRKSESPNSSLPTLAEFHKRRVKEFQCPVRGCGGVLRWVAAERVECASCKYYFPRKYS